MWKKLLWISAVCGLSLCLQAAELVADFRFEDESDPGMNALGEGIADITFNPNAVVKDGYAQLRERSSRNMERNLLLVYQNMPEAWRIELEFTLDAIDKDQYIFSSEDLFLRYSVAFGTFQFGVQQDQWYEVAAKPHIGKAGHMYRISCTVDGAKLTLQVDDDCYTVACPAVPRGGKLYLGALAWESQPKNDFAGVIDHMRVFALEKVDLTATADVIASPATLALFNFNGTLSDGVEMGAALLPGDTAVLAARRGGCLRLDARQSLDQQRCRIVQLPANPDGFYLEMDFNMHTNGPFAGKDMILAATGNMFVRYSVDRGRMEFGVLLPDGWKQVASDRSKCGIEMNRWFRIGCLYDGTALKLYIDDELQGTTPATGKAVFSDMTLGSCGWANDLTGEFDGWLDAIHYATMKIE